MVDDYKSSLYRNNYREFVLKSLMDTVLNKNLYQTMNQTKITSIAGAIVQDSVH